MTKLPDTLTKGYQFTNLFKLKPEGRSKIVLFDKDEQEFRPREIFRSYMSYLFTPMFDPNVKKSYMFLNKAEEVPVELVPFIGFAKQIDQRYNQMVVNWYEPEDYIEAHRDCTAKMIENNSDVLVININESDDIYNIRNLVFINVETNEYQSVPLLNNTYHIIKNNNTHRHYVGRGVERRISITFRMIKED